MPLLEIAFELPLTRVSSGFSQDSLAAEIEGTMRKELQLEEPDSPDIAYGLTSKLPSDHLVTCDGPNKQCVGLPQLKSRLREITQLITSHQRLLLGFKDTV